MLRTNKGGTEMGYFSIGIITVLIILLVGGIIHGEVCIQGVLTV